MRREWLLGIVGAIAVSAATPASATLVTLEDNNSIAKFNFDAVGENILVDWLVDGVEQIYEQNFYLRIGTGSVQNLGELTPTAYGALNSDFDGDVDDDLLTLNYTIGTVRVQVRYTLVGGAPGSGVSDIAEQISITNNGTTAVDIDFFQYSDFDVGGDAPDDTVVLTNANTILQSDEGSFVAETVITPTYSRVEVGPFSTVRNHIEAGNDLDGTTSFGPGDATWAFQWETNLGRNGTYIISKDKRIGVPEPASLALLGTGLVGFGWLTRRRRQAA